MKARNGIAVLAAFVLTAQLGCPARAATTNTTQSPGDWSSDSVWSGGHVPVAGEVAVVGHALSLTNVTAALAGLVVNSGGITCDGWDTAIRATEVTINGGELSHVVNSDTNATAGWTPNARVYVVCSNLTLASGGRMDGDTMGFQVGPAGGSGYGPGGGSGIGNRGGGGSYGGKGGRSDSSSIVAPVYGSTNAPSEPGSGGGSKDGYVTGGDGGGCVRVEATGHVIINGTITVNGSGGTGDSGGGGAGGGVCISCTTIAGSGTISAVGGNGTTYGGGGGGGRIAVTYDIAQQQALGQPALTLTTKEGRKSGTNNGQDGDVGTVYLADTLIVPRAMDGWNGQLHFDTASDWSVDALTIEDGWVGFPDGFDLTVTNDMQVFADARCDLATGAVVSVGGNLQVLTDARCNVAGATVTSIGGDLVVSNASSFYAYRGADSEELLSIGGDVVLDSGSLYYYYAVTNPTCLSIGGDLTLANSSRLYLYSGDTNAAGPAYGGLLDLIGRDLTVPAGCTICPDSRAYNGGSVKMQMRDLTLNGTIQCDASGFNPGSVASSGVGYGPGGGTSGLRGGGGGHGGEGGDSAYQGMGGPVNGYEKAPAWPGSGGGAKSSGTGGDGGRGGGFAWVEAAGNVVLDGTITANGGASGGDSGGGGAGGAIRVSASDITGGGNLYANGGAGARLGGGGGGGRIAVVTTSHAWDGSVSPLPSMQAAGGAGGSSAPAATRDGDTGTVYVAFDPDTPRIDNRPVANNAGASADLVGELTSTGAAATTVMVFWGTSDGAYTPNAWDTNTTLATGASLGWFTNSITDLQAATLYYYRFYATNSAGHDWGEPATFFTTSGAPDVNNNGGATNITLTTALLRGVAQGTPDPAVTIYWGTSNGLSDPLAWEHEIDVGLVTELDFVGTATGLVANQAYYYRCFATNSNGGRWAALATNFQTASPGVGVRDVSLAEGNSGSTAAAFVVALTAPSALDVSVGFATSNGVALAGVDYTETNGVLVVAAGTTSGIVNVLITGDLVDEYPSESFTLSITSAVSATVTVQQAIGTIVDDDPIVETLTWTGVGTWDTIPNWSPAGSRLPDPSDTVIIPAATTCTLIGAGRGDNVTLSGTLTFSGPGAVLEASDVEVTTTGVMQHDIQSATDTNALGQWEVDNAITIVCTNLTVRAGGLLDADEKGFLGGTISHRTGYGPGGGLYSSLRGGGGSYGGHGGKGEGTGESATYGETTAPVDPGSGGGSQYDASGGGHGGGLVKITANQQVLLNGTITANGESGAGHSGGGSGGGVHIACRTFQGTTGRITTDGGDAYSVGRGGGGGGGRIAVTYDVAAQQALGVPAGVQLSANGGSSGSYSDNGELGTVYLTDTLGVPLAMDGSNGRLAFDAVATWSPNALEVIDGWIVFPDGFELNIADTLSVVDNARCDVTESVVTCGGDLVVSNGSQFYAYRGASSTEALNIGGDLVLDAGTMGVWFAVSNPASLSIAGDMIVLNSSTVNLYPGPTNTAPYGGLLDLDRSDLTVGAGSVLHAHSFATSYGSIKMKMHSLDLDGTIQCNGYGFSCGTTDTSGTGYGPGGGTGSFRGGGGGFGGKGGNSESGGIGGPTNGLPDAPAWPGSGGGSENSGAGDAGGYGGGFAWIEASGNVAIDGEITANGNGGTGDGGGGGAGGAILISCRAISGGGDLTASGGNGASRGGGGGGGRIAVFWSHDSYTGGTNVTGGVGGSYAPDPAGDGGVGTVVWGIIPPSGTVFFVR